MDIISVISQKGGCGKTTLTLSLAVAAEREGKTTVIIDLDPQPTISRWGDRRVKFHDLKTPVVISAQAARLENILQTAREMKADIVFIDSPPRAADAAQAAAQQAHLILVPCSDSIFDLETVSTTKSLLGLAKYKAAFAVLNGLPPSGPERQQAVDMIEKDYDLLVCPAGIGDRKAFKRAAVTGLSAQEYDPDGKAADEVEEVYKFVSTFIKKLKKGVNNGEAETGRFARSINR